VGRGGWGRRVGTSLDETDERKEWKAQGSVCVCVCIQEGKQLLLIFYSSVFFLFACFSIVCLIKFEAHRKVVDREKKQQSDR
jgi:hypothetical protein